MNIATLEKIHELLKDECEKAQASLATAEKELERCRKEYRKSADGDARKTADAVLTCAEKAYADAVAQRKRAYAARNDFEDQEF